MNELRERLTTIQNQLREREGEGDTLQERITGLENKYIPQIFRVDYLMNELERYVNILN